MIQRLRSPRPLAAAGVAVAGVAVAGVVFWQVVVIGLAVQDIRIARERLTGGDRAPSTWSVELDRLSGGLGVLRDRVAWLDPSLRLVARLPVIGRDIEAARGLLGSGAELTAGAAALARLGVPDPSVRGETSFGALPVIARHLREEPRIAGEAARRFERAVAERRAWSAQPRLTALSRLTEPLDEYLPVIDGMAVALPEAGFALGVTGPRRYLLVAQNNHELRPGGGFIGNYATITIDQGHVTDFTFGDSYEIDGRGGPIVEPPRPLQEFGGFPLWLFRDVNWSADFPTNALRLQEFYQRDRPGRIDGVIALDLTAFQSLLRVVGPVEVPDFGETVTGDNVLELTNRYVNYTGSGESRHKQLLGAVAEQLAGRLLDPRAEQMPALGRAVVESFATKHLMVALNQPKLAEGLRRANFDGHQGPADADYLMVVDTNLSYNKANAQIHRDLAYDVQQETGSVSTTATLTVTYHFEPATTPQPIALYDEYRNYARIYLPAETQIRDVSGFLSSPEIGREGDKLVIGGFLVVHPGDSETVRLRYTRPAGTPRDDPYRLVIQKQPGISADQVAIAVKSVAGREVIAWEGALSRDTVLTSPADRPGAAALRALGRQPTEGLVGSHRWHPG